MERIKIVGLGGSLATNSTSLGALKIALEAAQEAGAETALLDIRALDLPLYNPDATEAPAQAQQMAETVYQANGLIWSSPLYHGSVSGAFKNALDWLQLLSDHDPPYLTNKVIGLISTAGGVQGLQAVNTMEFAVRALRGWAVPMVIPIPRAWKVFDEDGHVIESRVEEQLHALAKEMVRASEQFAMHGYCDYAEV